MAVAITGPIPGTVMSRRATPALLARVAISRSRAMTSSCSCRSISTSRSRLERARLARIHPLGGKPSNMEEWRANAALIIAAPDLYEALEWAVEEIATPEQRASEWGHMARGVLARARGGS